MRNPLYGLLWKRRTWPQLLVGGLGFTLGLFILALTLRFGGAIRAALFPNRDAGTSFVVINKRVALGHTLGLSKTAFSTEELQELRDQPFVRDIGPLMTANFRVSASIFFALEQGYQTELFFEAVDERFLDRRPNQWHWSPGQEVIPTLISREFLALYNFGFAAAQGLPQLTEETIGLLPFEIVCAGREGPRPFSAHIAGFSDRFSTILVPMEFLTWANATLGQGQAPAPARVVLEVDASERAALQAFLRERSYETNEEKLGSAALVRSLRIALVLSTLFGGLLALVSLAVLVLTLQMLVGGAHAELSLLHQLGYGDGCLCRHYLGAILPAIVLPFTLAGLGVLLLGPLAADLFGKAGFEVTRWPTRGAYLSFLLIFVGVLTLLFSVILSMIRRIE